MPSPYITALPQPCCPRAAGCASALHLAELTGSTLWMIHNITAALRQSMISQPRLGACPPGTASTCVQSPSRNYKMKCPSIEPLIVHHAARGEWTGTATSGRASGLSPPPSSSGPAAASAAAARARAWSFGCLESHTPETLHTGMWGLEMRLLLLFRQQKVGRWWWWWCSAAAA